MGLKLTLTPETPLLVRTIYPDGSKSYWHLYNPHRRNLTVCLKSILDTVNHEVFPADQITDGEMCEICWPWDWTINKKRGNNE